MFNCVTQIPFSVPEDDNNFLPLIIRYYSRQINTG